MTLPIGTKLVIEHIVKEIKWRELCQKAGVDDKGNPTYTKKELEEHLKAKGINSTLL